MSQQGGYAGLLHELQGGAPAAPQQSGTGGYAALLHEAQAGQQPLAQPAYAQAPSSDYLLTGTPAPGENRPNVNQPYMPPQPAPRSVAGEFGAAVFRGAETMLAAPRALAFNQPVSELVTPGFEPSPAPAGAGLIRRGAHTTAQVAGGLVPAIGAGVVTAGAATPFIAPMLGTGLAATAASGVAGGVPIATQMAADMSERTGGDPAAVAASFGQNAALGAIPPLAVLNKIPGVRNVVGKAVEKFGAGPVMKYLAEVSGDAALAGGTNVGQAYVDEAIAQVAGADPREVDPVAEFLGGAGAVGALRFAGDLQRLRGRQAAIAKERNRPLPTLEEVDAEITANMAKMAPQERARAEEMLVRDTIAERMADPKFDPTSQLGQLREQIQSEYGLSGRKADRLIAAVRGRSAIERAFFQGDKPTDPNLPDVYRAFADEKQAGQQAKSVELPTGATETPDRRIVANRTAQTVDPRLVQQIIDEYSAARAGPMTQAAGSAGPYRYTGPAGEKLNIPTPADYPRALGADEAFAQKYELDPTFGTEALSLEEATWAARTLNNESPRYQHAIVQASADGERWVLARKRRPPGSARPEPTLYNQTNPASRESGQAQPSPTDLGRGSPQGDVITGDPARQAQSTEPDFSTMTYAELKAELRRRGMDTRGPRGLLQTRLENAGKPDPTAWTPSPDVPAQADTPTPRKEATNGQGQEEGQGRQEGLLSRDTDTPPAGQPAGSDSRVGTSEQIQDEIPDAREDLNRRIEEKKRSGMSHEDAFKAAQDDLTAEARQRLETEGAILVDEYGDEYRVNHERSQRGGPKDRQTLTKLTQDGVPYQTENERPWLDPEETLRTARRLRPKRERSKGLNAPEAAPTTENAPAPSVSSAPRENGAGGVARSELDRLELIRKWGDRWQYRTRPGGPWYYSNSESGAVEGASAGYQSTPESERLTRQQRDEKANAEWYDDVHARYKHLSIAQVQAIRDQAAGVRGVGPDAEFTGNGGRRSGAALSNQGARDAAETARTLDRYIEERTSKEADSPPQPPEPPAQVPPPVKAQPEKPDRIPDQYTPAAFKGKSKEALTQMLRERFPGYIDAGATIRKGRVNMGAMISAEVFRLDVLFAPIKVGSHVMYAKRTIEADRPNTVAERAQSAIVSAIQAGQGPLGIKSPPAAQKPDGEVVPGGVAQRPRISTLKVGDRVMVPSGDETLPATVVSKDRRGMVVRFDNRPETPTASFGFGPNEPRFDLAPPLSAKSGTKPDPGPLVVRDLSTGQETVIPETRRPGEPTDTPPAKLLADTLQRRLSDSDATLTADEVFNLARRAFGGTMAEGKFSAKDATDALELAVNKTIQKNPDVYDPHATLERSREIVRKLEALTDRLPTQTRRDTDTERLQQFSTPPAYAYAVARIANIGPYDSVIEPSAGTGSIAVHAMNAGPREVTVNELAPDRAALVRELGPDRVFTENAEQLDNVLPADVRPTVVVMNPPFSQTAGRMGDKKVLMAGANHIEQAYNRLEPGGRLVAIVGRGMSLDAQTYRAFWPRVPGLRANVEVSGDVYGKYGTKFGTRVLVWDKPRAGESPAGDVVTGSANTIGDLLTLTEGLRNARTAAREPQSAATSSPQGARSGQADARPGGAVPPATDGVGARPQGTGSEREGPGGPVVRGGVDAGGTAQAGAGNAGQGIGVDSGSESTARRPDRRGADGVERPASIPDGARPGVPPGDGNRVDADRMDVEATDRAGEVKIDDADRFQQYTPRKLRIAGARPHPTALSESSAMAAVEPPDVRYRPSIPKKIIESGALSEPQVEAVVYAGQAHQATIGDSKTRRGFFIGDGTGVGKGREIVGIIADNFAQGRTKAVWISETQNLEKSASRDLQSLGIEPAKLVNLKKTKVGESVQMPDGILYTTYSTMGNGRGSADGYPRIKQIVDWFGKDYDGVVVFDEAHNMANAVERKGKRGKVEAAEKALAGLELQKQLPNARVVYVSATGATEVGNLAYAERLGLWGPGTAFDSRQDFIASVEAGGLGAMEMVAQDLKATGKYLARSLSFRDPEGRPGMSVEMEPLDHELTPQQRKSYDEMARAWQTVLRNIYAAIELTAGFQNNRGETRVDGKAKGQALSKFWGAHQRFFNQIITSMKVPSLIKAIEADMREGRSAIIQLTSTNEAQQGRALEALADGDSLDDLDLSPKDILINYLEKAFPVHQYEKYVDELGNERTRVATDSSGNPVVNRRAVQIRDETLSRIKSVPVVDAAMDQIINHFGPEIVAEVTGRKERIVRYGGATTREKRPPTKPGQEAKEYNDGKRRILIFSEKGGTGESYHADRNFKNQQRRVHYLLQAGWKADKAMQGLGRAHRSNEASAPILRLVSSDLKGERRFLSTIARRLDQLGALTKGQRDAGGGGIFRAEDNLESREAKAGLSQFYEDVMDGRIPEINESVLRDELGLKLRDADGSVLDNLPPMSTFLNRVLSMPIDQQNQVFDAFFDRVRSKVQQATDAGTLDTGVQPMKADSIQVAGEQVVRTDDETGSTTKIVSLKVRDRVRPIPFNEADRRMGFAINNQSGRIYAITNVTPRTDPETGQVRTMARLLDAKGNAKWHPYEHINDAKRYRQTAANDEARAAWDRSIKELPEFEERTDYLATGLLLPVWNRLGEDVRVRRVRTDDGKVMIGRLLDADSINDIRRNFGVTETGESGVPGWVQRPADAISKVLEGWTLKLGNGWRLQRRTVAGEDRVQIIGPDFDEIRGLEQRAGILSEKHGYELRAYIPGGDKAREVFNRIVGGRDVVEATPPKKRSAQSLGIVPPGTRELWAAIDRAEKFAERLGEGARVTQRAAAFIFGKATTYARLLGPEGKDIARSMERIQKDTTQNANTDVQAIKKVLAGLSREDVRIVAKIANGRGNWADTRPDLVPYVEKLRPHFDRVMLEARRVGIMRGKGPKKVILEGSGAYVPEVPNAEGRKFIEEIKDPNQSDKQSAAVAAWADQLVADGFVNTPEEAIQRLVDYRDRLRRGLQPYLESFRVPLPEHMVNWDIRETVPPVLERSWQTVEAVREWNSDPANALGNDGSATLDLLTAKLERIRKSKGNAPADAIQAWADYSFGKKAPNPAASAFFGAWSNMETLTRLGGSLLSAATNYTQQFVNTARLSPWAVAKAIKDYPPFLHPFMKSAVEARELAERAGGVSDVSALTPLEGQHAGYKLARAALYPFRRVEVTNQVRTSLAAAHQAVDDIDRLIRMEGDGPLSGIRKAFESLGSFSGVDTTGGLKRRAAAMLDITPEQLAAKVKRHERLTPEEIADVMHRFSRDTQFLMGVATEPAWFRQSPIARLAFKFKTWGARQLGLIYRDVVKEARYGNFAPLVRFTVATVVLGEIVQALRDWVKETENSATMYVAGGGRDTGEIAGRVLKSMAGGGAFGMLSDLTYGLGSFAFGPAGSTLGNVAEAASGAKDAILTKGGEGLGAVGDRFLRNQIPAYTQADRLFDKTVAAASGDLSELKRQTTLRLWRQRAMDFAKSKQERTVGQKVAGRIDDAIYGRYRVAGEANENTRPFEYAARAIDRGDVDEAADYLRIVLKNTPPGEMDSKVRAIESSLRIRAPLGRVAEKDYGKFLSTYTPEQRREAIKADNRWRADYSKAIGRAMANRWARDDAAD